MEKAYKLIQLLYEALICWLHVCNALDLPQKTHIVKLRPLVTALVFFTLINWNFRYKKLRLQHKCQFNGKCKICQIIHLLVRENNKLTPYRKR